MHTGLRLLLLSPLAALLACGGSPSGSLATTPATPAYNFNGTWGASAISSIPQYLPFNSIGGSLKVANGTVTGTLVPISNYTSSDPNLCAAVNTSLTVTGTLDSNQDLTLTFPIAGGTGTLLAALGNNPANYTYGTWTVAGGTCAMSVTPMVIQQTAPTTPPVASTPATITAGLSGNWGVLANYNSAATPASEPVTGFSGALQFSNGTVTGILTASPKLSSACNSYIANFGGGTGTVTGVFDASNNLALTFPIAGGEAAISASLGSNPQTLAYGSYQIVGGLCAIGATPMTIAQYAPVTGTYTGTFTIPNTQSNAPTAGSSISVTAVLTQATTSNSSGQFPITGTVSVTGACTDTATLASTGTVNGSEIYSASDTGNVLTGPLFVGEITPSASTILWAEFTDASNGSNCNAGIYLYQGTLTRQ